MSRPEYQPSDKDRRQVKALSALGTRHEDMAKFMDIAPKTLRKHFRDELDRGAIEANAKVVETLFKMATSGKNTSASIYWTKARCGWREKAPQSELTDLGLPPFTLNLRDVDKPE